MGNLCGRKIIGYIDYENGIYFIVSNNFNINPLIQNFYFLKDNNIIKIDNILNKYRNNIPLWIILKYENINPDNIFIKDLNGIIKILKVNNHLDKTLFEILT